MDTFPKKTSRWPTDTWQDAQRHSSSEKYKSKPHWDTTSHWSEWLKWTNQETTGAGEDAEKWEPSCTVGGNANWCSRSGKHVEVPQKVKNRTILWSSNFTTRYLPKEYKNTDLKGHMNAYVCTALSTIAKLWKVPKCPWTDEWTKKGINIYIMEYDSAIKRMKSCHLQWYGWLENIMQSEIGQLEKDKYHMISLMWSWGHKQREKNKRKK